MPAIGSVNVKIGATAGGLISGLGIASKGIKTFGGTVTSLGSNIASKFSGGIKAASSGVASLGSSLISTTAKLGPLAAGVAAVAGVTGLGAMVSSSMETLDANKKLAGSLGITQDELTGYQHAANLSGVSSETLTGALGKLTRKGISLDVLADKMAAIQDPTERANLAFDTLGRSGMEMIPLLSEGGDKIREMMADGVALGGSFSTTDISGIEAANDAISRVKASFVGIANTVAAFVAPAIQTIADKVTVFGTMGRDAFNSMKPFISEVAVVATTAFSIIGSAIGAVWTWVSTATSGTFSAIGTTIWDTIKGAVGFFANFQSNIGIIYDWLSLNWWNVLKDMGSALVTVTWNMIKNVGTAFKGFVRIGVAFQGWLGSMFRKLFSFEVVDAVLSGLIIAGEAIRKWAEAAWTTISNIFTGNAPGADIPSALEQMKQDLSEGAKEVNFGKTMSKIFQETAKDFVSPLDGFKSSLTDMPKLKLAVPGLGDKTKPAPTEQMTAPDMAAMMTQAAGVNKRLEELKGPQAVNRSSSDAVSAILAHQRGADNNMKKTAESQLREMIKVAKGVDKLVKAPKTELVAGSV